MERKITSVGIDVSKGKSTVCILRPYGEIICAPFEVQHTEDGLGALAEKLHRLDGGVRVVMEATGIYWYYVKKKYKLNVDFLSNQWNPIPLFSAIMSSRSSNSVNISSRNS